MFAEQITRLEWVRSMLDFAFPPVCLGCGEYEESDESICSACLAKITWFQYPICLTCFSMIGRDVVCDRCHEHTLPLFASGDYGGPLKEIIGSFKFRGITSPAQFFAHRLVEQFSDRVQNLKADLLVPVPLYPTRECQRGFNQAALLCRELSRELSITCSDHLVIRTRKRRPQARLRKSQRTSNIRGVFEVSDEAVGGQRVILVDDVVTTGATVREVLTVLEKAGYTVAGVLAAGHGI
jgi:ComF family protein